VRPAATAGLLAVVGVGAVLVATEGGDIAVVLLVAAALTAVFAPLTNKLYRKG